MLLAGLTSLWECIQHQCLVKIIKFKRYMYIFPPTPPKKKKKHLVLADSQEIELLFVIFHMIIAIWNFRNKQFDFDSVLYSKECWTPYFTSSMSWQKPFASSDLRSLVLFSWKRLRNVSISPSTRMPSVLSKRGLAPAKTCNENITSFWKNIWARELNWYLISV